MEHGLMQRMRLPQVYDDLGFVFQGLVDGHNHGGCIIPVMTDRDLRDLSFITMYHLGSKHEIRFLIEMYASLSSYVVRYLDQSRRRLDPGIWFLSKAFVGDKDGDIMVE